MIGSFSLGRLFGFRIRIDWSWFIVFGLVVWTFSRFEFPTRLPGQGQPVYYAMGVVGAVLFFVSVLLHELAHSAVARARGIPVEGITLFIFGGVAQMRMEARRPLDEFLLTVVGPISSFLIAGIFYAVDVAVDFFGGPPPVGVTAGFLALLNAVLAIFNLVPAFPLDGGRIFRSIVWRVTGSLETATRWATWLGRGFGYLLLTLGLLSALQGFLLAGAWAALLGWFIVNVAASSQRQFAVRKALAGARVGDVMVPGPVTVDPDLSAEELVERYFLRWPFTAYPVVRDGNVLGLVALDAVAAVPPPRRGSVRASELMRPAGDVPTARPDETLDEVVGRLEPADEGMVLVVEDGGLVGVLTVRDIGSWVEKARRLGRVGRVAAAAERREASGG